MRKKKRITYAYSPNLIKAKGVLAWILNKIYRCKKSIFYTLFGLIFGKYALRWFPHCVSFAWVHMRTVSSNTHLFRKLTALMSFRNQHQYKLVKSRTFMRIIWKIWSLIDVLILMRLASCAVVRMNKAVPADLWILNFNEIYILKDYNVNLTAICCPVIKPLKYE